MALHEDVQCLSAFDLLALFRQGLTTSFKRAEGRGPAKQMISKLTYKMVQKWWHQEQERHRQAEMRQADGASPMEARRGRWGKHTQKTTENIMQLLCLLR